MCLTDDSGTSHALPPELRSDTVPKKEQTKQVTQNRGNDRDHVSDVSSGLADYKLLCRRIAGAEGSQLTEGNAHWLS